MQTTQDDWPQLARALERAVKSSAMSNSELAKASGADYFAIRRMRTKGVVNRSKNAKALCKFLGLSVGSGPMRGTTDSGGTLLEQRVREAWDGTPAHRQFLEDLLALASQYKVKPR